METQNYIKDEYLKENFQNDASTIDTSSSDSHKSIGNSNLYWKACCKEDYKVDFLDKSKHTIKLQKQKHQFAELIKRNFLPWKNISKASTKLTDCSGYGGSKTWIVETISPSVEQQYRKLIFHQRVLCKINPATDKRMLSAQKFYWENGVGVPRYVSGLNWYVEPFIDSSQVEDDSVYIKLIARAHKNTSTDWFEVHRERLIKNYPILNEARKGCSIWSTTTRMSHYKQDKKNQKFMQEAGLEPLSKAGKRIVTTHGDIHHGNMLVDKNMKAYIIDYELTSPTWAVNDLSMIFQRHLFGTSDLEGKRRFCKIYLEELGLLSTEEEIDLLILDSEVNKTRIMGGLVQFVVRNSEPIYNCELYKKYEQFEEEARHNKELMQKVLEEGFTRLGKIVIEKINPADLDKHSGKKKKAFVCKNKKQK